jgi:hypothetical protein
MTKHDTTTHTTPTRRGTNAALVKSRLDDLAGEELEALGVWEPLDRDRARRVRVVVCCVVLCATWLVGLVEGRTGHIFGWSLSSPHPHHFQHPIPFRDHPPTHPPTN